MAPALPQRGRHANISLMISGFARWFGWAAVLVIVIWGVAGTLFAMRRFSWAPRRR